MAINHQKTLYSNRAYALPLIFLGIQESDISNGIDTWNSTYQNISQYSNFSENKNVKILKIYLRKNFFLIF
jgi:hypothetical protein